MNETGISTKQKQYKDKNTNRFFPYVYVELLKSRMTDQTAFVSAI